jgi:hypothetical protein
VDARLHRVQGKAEFLIYMTGLLDLLEDFHRDKLAAFVRHQGTARVVEQYDANNAYQYVIAREETQLSWVEEAIAAAGGKVVAEAASGPGDAPVAKAAMSEDVREAQEFVDRWRPRIETMDDARYRGMLRIIVGETLEHKRFFEQALAGRMDLLGRRSDAVGARVGTVLPTRWIE